MSQSRYVTQDLVPPTPEDQAESVGSIDEITESLVPAVEISTEYDADMSASLDKTQEPSISEVRPDDGPAGIKSSPAASTSGTEISSQSDEIAAETPVADVFGPASSVAKPSPKRKGRKRSSARHSSKSSRSRSSTAELDVKPTIVSGSYDETEITATRSQKPARLGSKAPYELQLPQTRDAAGKASFISSASKWMSRLPKLWLSPSRPAFDTNQDDSVEEDDEEEDPEGSPAVVGRKRKIPHQLGRSYSQPELGATTRTSRSDKRQTPLSRSSSQTRSSKRSKMNHIQPEAVIVIEDSDGEDELILSPETAKKRKAEEERASRGSMGGSSPLKETQHSTGRFDGKSPYSELG